MHEYDVIKHWYNCAFSGGAVIFLEAFMEKRIAVIGIIIENKESVEMLNSLLHEFGDIIVGRMGLPYKERNLSIMSLAVDAPQNTISELTGKIGKLDGISVKTAYSNKIFND